MAAYATAWAGDSPLACDAVTASPYLGFGSLRPLARHRRIARPRSLRAGRDVQPGGSERAASRRSDGRTVAQSIVDDVGAENRSSGTGSVGVVVGATLSDVPDLGALGGPVLVPGVGAQGGRPDALRGLGGAANGTVLPAVSREVLRAGPDVAALRAAGERMRDAVAYLSR